MAIIPKNSPLPVQLNLNVRGLKPSATLAANEKPNQLRAAGGSIYKLGLGQSPFPVPDPVVEALRANAFQKDYLQVKGLPGLRDAVAGYRRRRHGTERTGEDVLIGPGSKPLMFLLQLVYYGDLVIATPSWCSYAPQAQIIGRHVRWLNTRSENGWRLTSEDLEELCKEDKTRPRIVILNYPSNPTGGSYSPTELKAIAQVARANGVILLSDEIYGELHHAGKHDSIARFYPEGTIISSGLSKWCGAGGWRLGTFIFPPGLRWLLDAMANVASETYTSTSAPIQYAAVRAFQGGSAIETYLAHSRRVLRVLGRHLAERLRTAGVSLELPEGAFYLFPDFTAAQSKLLDRDIHTSVDLCDRLLEDTGVAVLPGSAFGRPPEELTARIAYVDFDGSRALAASQAIPLDRELDERFLQSYCKPTLEGVDLICDWIRA